MYTLYGSPKTRAGRVMWMLEEIGAAYEWKDVAPHSPEVAAISPIGKLPVLVDGETVVTDSTAALLHLADRAGKMTYPAGSAERARMTSILCFAIDAMEQPLWTVAKHALILPEDLRRLDAVTPACRAEWMTAIQTLERILGDGPYVMGEEFTVPDVVIGHLGGWAKGAGFPTPEGAVGEYMTRVRSRPAWRAVVSARSAA